MNELEKLRYFKKNKDILLENSEMFSDMIFDRYSLETKNLELIYAYENALVEITVLDKHLREEFL